MHRTDSKRMQNHALDQRTNEALHCWMIMYLSMRICDAMLCSSYYANGLELVCFLCCLGVQCIQHLEAPQSKRSRASIDRYTNGKRRMGQEWVRDCRANGQQACKGVQEADALTRLVVRRAIFHPRSVRCACDCTQGGCTPR